MRFRSSPDRGGKTIDEATLIEGAGKNQGKLSPVKPPTGIKSKEEETNQKSGKTWPWICSKEENAYGGGQERPGHRFLKKKGKGAEKRKRRSTREERRPRSNEFAHRRGEKRFVECGQKIGEDVPRVPAL